jgi:uncharacterized repeat protein (TIGR03803 family)
MMVAKSLISRLSLVLPLLALGFAAKIASAQPGAAVSVKFTTLHSFSGVDGANPAAVLVQAANGELYGTTSRGGAFGGCSSIGACGTVFKITPEGTLTTLYSFCAQSGCTDGLYPRGGVVQATNGDLYGTTFAGGAYAAEGNGGGTIFKITPSGTFTTLYSFCAQSECADGDTPFGGLAQAANGDLYGTTANGGANKNSDALYGGGTVFKITPHGALTTPYSFCSLSVCTDGEIPYGGLVQAPNEDLYGTTIGGGANCLSLGGCGTIFKITPSGTLTTLYSFCAQSGCPDGQQPQAGLVRATNGALYGTTTFGGTYAEGTVFKINPSGTLTTLYSFCPQSGCADGYQPYPGLIQASDGNLYGTTPGGGANGDGTVFKMTPSGTLTTLYSFCAQSACADGQNPTATLVQATNGDLYGTTEYGGAAGDGTVFRLSVGLHAFVDTLPTIGVVGEKVTIVGYGLKGATSVTFNGLPAAFTVDGSTAITTTVPTGATTGKVQVVTPGGTLLSKVAFEVVP